MADILVIDDEENLSFSIQLALQRAGHRCRICDTGSAALEEAARRNPDLALVDLHLPDVNGIDLIARFHEHGWDFPIIVITAHGTVDRAVKAMKQGAADFLQKPVSMEEVVLAVDRCLENRLIRNQLDAYRHAQRQESTRVQIIGQCSAMQEVIRLAERIAAVEIEPEGQLPTTLLLGETGTGKELIARYIHHHSPHPDRPFVHLNCTAIPENLFESELFGHERGTFTDAKTAKKGLLETAQEGTLLLDEIGDMPPSVQAKLLVAIESGRFRRLGGTTERVARVRVMAATNSDLERKVAAGEFRADLYYRLKLFCIELPPLRERGDDLFLLAEHFIEQFARKFRKPVPELPEQTRRAMRAYRWPGNVRELANVLQRTVLINDSGRIEPADLGITPAGTGPAAGQQPGIVFDFASGDCTLAAVEKRLIEAALAASGYNTSEAARMLGLTRGALRHRLEKHGIDANRHRAG